MYIFHRKTMPLSISNLISSKFEGAPCPKLSSSMFISHKNPYSSSPLEVISLLVSAPWENWRRFSRELLWLWWDGVEANEVIWLYPQGMVWLVGPQDVVSNISWLLSSKFCAIPLLLWNTLHKTQSSCNQNA